MNHDERRASPDVCGDLAEVERPLAERPQAALERGGPRGWAPLLYLCFTRFSRPPVIRNAVAIARALLDRGANPNAAAARDPRFSKRSLYEDALHLGRGAIAEPAAARCDAPRRSASPRGTTTWQRATS